MADKPINNRATREFVSRFKIVSKLGEGGMGKVYKAHDPALNKVFALKVLVTEELSDQHKIRFQQEAKTLKELKHKGIPEVYNFAISRDGEPYLVMEYIDGKSLSQLLDEKIKFSKSQIQNITIQVCDALQHAHKNGIIHRDIKPDNIVLIGEDLESPTVKLIDFGIAQLEDDLNKGQNMTQTGVIIGSPPYINPEQIRGEKAEIQSDIYSLGCVLYELATGNPPFQGKNALNTLSMHLEVPVENITYKIPEEYNKIGMSKIIEKCLQKKITDRYQTAIELRDAVYNLKLESKQPVDSQAVIEVEEFESASMKSLVQIIVGLVLATILIVGVFSAISHYLGDSIGSKTELSNETKNTFNQFGNALGGTGNSKGWQLETTLGSTPFWRGGDNITDADFKILAKKKILQNHFIRSEFSDNITGSGIKHLRNASFNGLVVASKKADNRLLFNLKYLPHLKFFVVGLTKKFTIEGFRELSKNQQIIRLGIKNNLIPSGGLKEISNLKNLKSLRLDGSMIDPAELKYLADLPKLNKLYLEGTKDKSGNSLSAKSLVVINNCKNLKALSLRSLNIKDADIKYIKTLKISILDLTGNPITESSIIALASNKYLKELILGDFNFEHQDKEKTINTFKQKNKNCKLNLEFIHPAPYAI